MSIPRHLISTAKDLVTLTGHAPSDTNVEQMAVFLMAFDKFVERNAVYKDLWREEPCVRNIEQCEHKAARAKRVEVEEVRLDSLIDLLNYGGFSIRTMEPSDGQA